MQSMTDLRDVDSSVPPQTRLVQMVTAIWTARALYAAARLGIADLLGDEFKSAEHLARLTGTHPPSLYRLLRTLAAEGLFCQSASNSFALTDLGRTLRSDVPGGARATILTLGGDWQWQAWTNFMHALKTGKSGLEVHFGESLFDYLARHPDDAHDFDQAMVGLYSRIADTVIEIYDFSRFETVADLGGGTGTLLCRILEAHPQLRGMLIELPDKLSAARQRFQNAGLIDRCEARHGDFFGEVPRGWNLGILSHVLHDWNDDQAVQILRNCRNAIPNEDGHILIIEAIVPRGDGPHHSKMLDLLMLTVTGGRERTADEFENLLVQGGFRLARILAIDTHQSIIEAVPV